jgi:predicted dienelactone hydrolase
MRPIETLLLTANVLTFFVLVVPRPRVGRWMRHLAPIAVLIAVAQALVEGPRWQMLPAYTLTGLFFLVWLRQSVVTKREAAGQKRTNRVVISLTAGLGVLGLGISIALPIMFPVFRLPNPSGPYEIGTLTYHWVDASRQEVFSSDPKARRELMVQVWYPAKKDSSSPRAPYIQDAEVGAALLRPLHVPEFILGHLKYVSTHANSSAPALDDKPNYPVLTFMEGLDGFRQMNTNQVEELVSHGYIVAAIDQPYTAATVVFPDGRRVGGLSKENINALIQQSVSPAESAPVLNGLAPKQGIVPYLAQDAIFTLNQLTALNQADPNGILTGRLDLQHAGIFGISLGGIVVGEACRLDPRFHACLVMDAPMTADVVKAGLQQPSMWITRDTKTMQLEGWPQADITQTQTTMRAVFESLPGDGYFVRIPGIFHLNLTDIQYWSPLLPRLGITGPIDGQRAHAIIMACSRAFFDRHLKGSPAAQLDGLAKQYPEMLLETRRPL